MWGGSNVSVQQWMINNNNDKEENTQQEVLGVVEYTNTFPVVTKINKQQVRRTQPQRENNNNNNTE